jgi:hypothetical protein
MKAGTYDASERNAKRAAGMFPRTRVCAMRLPVAHSQDHKAHGADADPGAEQQSGK